MYNLALSPNRVPAADRRDTNSFPSAYFPQTNSSAHAAFAAGVKKSGYDISPENQEKITDAGRQGYEKMSG